MKQLILKLASSRLYWAFVATVGILLIAAALYYQYALDEYPCVLCVHVRMWIAAVVLQAFIFMALPPKKWVAVFGHALSLIPFAGLIERSWKLYAVENHMAKGACSMDSGLPDWLALDAWIPWLFGIEAPCGYTPEFFGLITMAESLLLISVAAFLVALVAGVTVLISRPVHP